MTGSPDDLGLPTKSEPKHDSLSKQEAKDMASRRADDGREKRHLRK